MIGESRFIYILENEILYGMNRLYSNKGFRFSNNKWEKCLIDFTSINIVSENVVKSLTGNKSLAGYDYVSSKAHRLNGSNLGGTFDVSKISSVIDSMINSKSIIDDCISSKALEYNCERNLLLKYFQNIEIHLKNTENIKKTIDLEFNRILKFVPNDLNEYFMEFNNFMSHTKDFSINSEGKFNVLDSLFNTKYYPIYEMLIPMFLKNEIKRNLLEYKVDNFLVAMDNSDKITFEIFKNNNAIAKQYTFEFLNNVLKSKNIGTNYKSFVIKKYLYNVIDGFVVFDDNIINLIENYSNKYINFLIDFTKKNNAKKMGPKKKYIEFQNFYSDLNMDLNLFEQKKEVTISDIFYYFDMLRKQEKDKFIDLLLYLLFNSSTGCNKKLINKYYFYYFLLLNNKNEKDKKYIFEQILNILDDLDSFYDYIDNMFYFYPDRINNYLEEVLIVNKKNQYKFDLIMAVIVKCLYFKKDVIKETSDLILLDLFDEYSEFTENEELIHKIEDVKKLYSKF